MRGRYLQNGKPHSCGCKRNEDNAARSAILNRKHGMSGSPTWNSWRKMKERCRDPKHPHFANYGGRGVKVCGRWINSFENFLADMGEQPRGRSIDRIDNDRDYEPGNCKWSTRREQCKNRRSTTLITLRGQTKSLIEWSRETGVKSPTICQRIAHGWTAEDAVFRPVRTHK